MVKSITPALGETKSRGNMKTCLIILVAIATASAHHQTCVPGSYYKQQCNTCVCAPHGGVAHCSQLNCGAFHQDGSLGFPIDIVKKLVPDATSIDIVKAPLVAEGHVTYRQVCTPNSYFQIGCNTCRCSYMGDTYACSRNACPTQSHTDAHHLRPHVPTMAERQICTPGCVFQQYCNTCVCSRDGLNVACTMKNCDKNVYNVDGSLKYSPNGHHRYSRSTQVCEPSSVSMDYCNTCKCASDGSGRWCTRMACDMDVFNKDGSLKAPYVCIPGTEIKKDCNTCTCYDGLSLSCTEKACN